MKLPPEVLRCFSLLDFWLEFLSSGQFSGERASLLENENTTHLQLHPRFAWRSNCKTRIRKVILLGTLYSIATTAIILLGIISVDTATITHYMSNATKLYLEISLSFVAAAAIGVPYYVVPTLFSATLGENKGLGSAFIDGFAYFCSGFLWAGLGNIVKIPIYGWLYTWLVVAGILATGGSIMTLFLHQHINCIKEFPILD